MLGLIKQVLFVLLSSSQSLATKCVSLNDEPCMVRPTVIDFYLQKYVFPKKINDVNVKVFNMITNKN